MPPSRFVADSSLEFIARRLRFLGYDVAGHPGARLEKLFEAALPEQRIVLTRSARHPRAFASVTRLSVAPEDPAAAVRAIALRHEPSGPPFSRCPECNTALQRRHPLEARGEVPGRVLRSGVAISHCPHCGRWYWEGTHVARIREWLERALGRPLAGHAGDEATGGGAAPNGAAGERFEGPRDESSET
jgi:uncharacterized protein with PIN domain